MSFNILVNSVSNIVMNKVFTVTPSRIVEGKPVSIEYDILNKGSDFNGTVSLDLHDESGYWIKNIGRYDNVDLKNNYHFTNGITYTSNNGFGVPPGTYQIVAWTFNQSLGWQIVKSYMENNEVTLDQLLKTEPTTIFNKSKYKPKKQ